jgi:hypothetical protein
VLAMLEGLKGDAGEVTRLAAAAPASTRDGPADPLGSGDQAASATTVHRLDPSDGSVSGLDGQAARALAARPAQAGGVQARLATVHAQARSDGGSWTARTLAEAAACGRSSAAAFLRMKREQADPAAGGPSQ